MEDRILGRTRLRRIITVRLRLDSSLTKRLGELDPISTAEAFEGLMRDQEWSQSELARRLGVHRSSVSRSMRLLLLPAQLKERIRCGELTPFRALRLANRDLKSNAVEGSAVAAALRSWIEHATHRHSDCSECGALAAAIRRDHVNWGAMEEDSQVSRSGTYDKGR